MRKHKKHNKKYASKRCSTKTVSYLPAIIKPSEIVKADGAFLNFRPDSFTNHFYRELIPCGLNLLFALRQACRNFNVSTSLLRYANVYINGVPIPYDKWQDTIIREHDFVSIVIPVMGGGGGGGGGGEKNPLNTVLTLVVAVIAAAATWYVGGWGGWATLGSWGGLVGSTVAGAVGAGIMMGGMLLVNAIAPASTPKLTLGNGLIGGDREQASQVWSIEGSQNKADPYGAVPVVLGKVRFAPRFAAQSYSVLVDNNQYVRYLYVVMNRVQVTEPRIGDNPLSNYVGSSIQIHSGWTGGSLKWFNQDVYEESFNILLRNSLGWVTRTTPANTTKVIVMISFAGLKMINREGVAWGWGCTIQFRYRNVATGATKTESIEYRGMTINVLRYGFTFDLPSAGQYEISLRRDSQDWSEADPEGRTIRDECTWVLMQSWQNSKSVIYNGKPLTLIELELQATEQLSGGIQEFNCLFHSYAPVPSGSSWTQSLTNNPASLALLVATGDSTGKPATMSEMDQQSYRDFYNWCNRYGWTYNGVQTSRVTAGEMLHNILAAGRGSYALQNGHGVIWDDPEGEIVDIITQRNSWGFSTQRTPLIEPIQGLRMRFLNEDLDYAEDERIVYNDGYSASNATNIIEWEQDGITDKTLIYKHGRLRLAELKLRPETYTFNVEAEGLTLRRGDRFRCVHDVTFWGVGSGRIIGLTYATNDTSRVTGFELDEQMTFNLSLNYGCRIQTYGQADSYFSIRPASEVTRKFTLSSPVPVSATNAIAIGQLVAVGRTESIGAILVVQSISPSQGLSVQITAVDAAPNIYDAMTGPIPPWNSQITKPLYVQTGVPNVPRILDVVSDNTTIIFIQGIAKARMVVSYNVPRKEGVIVGSVTLQYRCPAQDSSWTTVTSSDIVGGVSGVVSILDVEKLKTYQLRMNAISVTGLTSDWSPIYTHTVTGLTVNDDGTSDGLPLLPDITNFRAQLADNGILLRWDPLPVPGLVTYYLSWLDKKEQTTATSYLVQIYKYTGTVVFSLYAMDVNGRRTRTVTTSVQILPPAKPIVKAELLFQGTVCSWQNCKTTWTIRDYILAYVGMNKISLTTTDLKGVLEGYIPFNVGEQVTVKATDIFENSTTSDRTVVKIYYPQTPKIKLGYNQENGNITIDWQDCRNTTVADTPTIDHYEIDGTLANQGTTHQIVKIKGTHYEALIPLTAYEYGSQTENGILINVGTIYVRIMAVDMYGITNRQDPAYKDNAVSLSIYPPYNPTNMQMSVTEEGDMLLITWNDCTRTFVIKEYKVVDVSNKKTYITSSNYIILPMRKQGRYEIKIQATDVLGQKSSDMSYYITIAGVGGMTVTGSVDGRDIVLTWSIPTSSFIVDYYIVKRDNDVIPNPSNLNTADPAIVGTSKTNSLRIPAGQAKTYTFYVWAVDVAGNVSTNYASYTQVTVNAPNTTTVTAKLEGSGVRLNWSTAVNNNRLPIVAWDVVRQYSENNQTREESYGRVDINSMLAPAVKVGTHTYRVRALDSGGNLGPWGSVNFVAQAPGRVTITYNLVIDNNVQIYWTEPNTIFFPIKEYIFYQVERDGSKEYLMEIGHVDARFGAVSEAKGGTYTYGILPIDIAGNPGTRTDITCKVTAPPDFIFYDDFTSLFNGTKSYFVLDRNGGMLGPIISGETWTANINRATQYAGKTISTHKQKVDAGYKTWLEPIYNGDAKYTEPAIDHGKFISTVTYTLFCDYTVINGNPEILANLYISTDNKTWETAYVNKSIRSGSVSALTANFRYSKFEIVVRNGYVRINDLSGTLNIKEVTESGRTLCRNTDNGAGWTSESATPMLTGTWIPFSKTFIDVKSIPQPSILNNTNGYTAYVVFEDVVGPTGFRIFVKDKNGNRVTATVDWMVTGV